MAIIKKDFEDIEKIEGIIKNNPKLNEKLGSLFQKYSINKVIPCHEYEKLVSLYDSEYSEEVIYSYLDLNGYDIDFDELNDETSDDYYFKDDVYELYRKDLRNMKYDYKTIDELLIKYEQCTDPTTKKELKNQIIMMNLRLVVHIVSKMKVDHLPGLDKIDLIQEGNLGLMYAIEKYDSSKRNNNRFSTYAYYWIRVYAIKAIMDRGRTVRYPRHVEEFLKKIDQFEYDFYKDNGRFPTIKEIADNLGLDERKVMDYKSAGSIVSIEYNLSNSDDEDTFKIEDTIQDNQCLDEEVDQIEIKEQLWDLINGSKLTARERYIIIKAYGLDDNGNSKRLSDIARELNLTRENIRQRKENALKKIRNQKKIKNLKIYLEDE